jgi:hypothetical protein
MEPRLEHKAIVAPATPVERPDTISDTSFNAKEVNPIAIQGIGQGNGAGPQIWAAVSMVLLNALRETGAGAEFRGPIEQNEFRFVGYAFVDDTDLVVSDRRSTGDELVKAMQEALDCWEGCLRASGGALEPAKTFWYGVDFEWDKGNWQYKDQSGEVLQARGPNGNTEVLEEVSVSEARRTLGTRLAPDGNEGAQIEHMATLVRTWAEGIRTNKLPRAMAWVSFQTTMWPRLRYCLPATCLPKKKAEKLDTMIKVALLPAMGINRNFPKKLIYGAVARGGLGLPMVYHSQGIAGVVQVKRFLGDNTLLTGRLLTACAEAIQVEIGSEQWFFETDFEQYGPLASESKLKEVWRFCKEAGVDIRIQKPGLGIRRRGDRFIMDECIGKFKKGQCVRLTR